MIYFLRHGLDDEEYVGGHSDGDLVDEGIAQVIKSAFFIRDNLKVDRIITSDVKRSVSSALIVKTILDDDIPLSKTSLLRELDKGILTGRKKDTLTLEEEKTLNMTDINQKYPGGESMKDMYERVRNLVDSGFFKDKDKSLIVTHRGIINMLYFMFNDIPLSMNKTQFGVGHASIHEMDIDKKKIKRIF